MNHLRPRLSDFLSFEFPFLMFLFAGAYKAAPLFESVNQYIDVTALMTLSGVLIAPFVCLRHWQRPNDRQIAFCIFYGLLVAWAAVTNCICGVVEPEAMLKIQKLVAFNSWAVIAPLLAIHTTERIERLLRLIFLYSLVVVVQALAASSISDSVVFVGAFGTDHYHALGHAGGIGAVIAFGMLLASNHQATRVVFAGIVAISILAVFLSSTRQALVGVVPAVICLSFWLSPRRLSLSTISRSIVVILCILFFFFYFKGSLLAEANLDRIWDRMLSVFTSERGNAFADSERPVLWAEGIQLWCSNPIIGSGFGTYVVYSESGVRHPHNYFVELLAEMGCVGLLIGSLLIAIPARQIVGDFGRTLSWSVGTTRAIGVFLFFCAMFSGDVTDNRSLFALLSLIVGQASATQTSVSNLVINKRLPGTPRLRPVTN